MTVNVDFSFPAKNRETEQRTFYKYSEMTGEARHKLVIRWGEYYYVEPGGY